MRDSHALTQLTMAYGVWDASRVIDAQDGIRTRDLQISQEALAPLQIYPMSLAP